jgi:hypothetical protein
MHGRGVGIDTPAWARVPWFAAWLGPRVVGWVHSKVGLWAAAEVVVPLSRYRFEIQGLGEVHRVDPAGARLRLGVAARI